MAVRLNEIHPSLVHFPIALMPAAVGADLLANATDSDRLAEAGRVLMPIAAGSAAVSAVFGLIAAVEAKAEGKAADLLVTHRNMNLALTAVSTLMAAYRMRQRRAGAGYLALGLAGLAGMSYSAYLGGKMVYEHGIGVKPADGLRDGDSPEVTPANLGEVARRAVDDVQQAIPPIVDDARAGRIVPSLLDDVENPTAAPPGATSRGRTSDPGLAPPEGAGAPESMP
ncbi:MAG TPA: DUF2231 domain-containing protein [Gemmatirosa sp.]|nr:DUF2231 domain-containing protein [Gemmatirosa sp.]